MESHKDWEACQDPEALIRRLYNLSTRCDVCRGLRDPYERVDCRACGSTGSRSPFTALSPPSRRKEALLACAFARKHLWLLADYPSFESCVWAVEQIADDKDCEIDIRSVANKANRTKGILRRNYESRAANAVLSVVNVWQVDPHYPVGFNYLSNVLRNDTLTRMEVDTLSETQKKENKLLRQLKTQCEIIRDIFAPFLILPEPETCSWLTPTVKDMAQSIYDEGLWGDVGVLGDALEESGCEIPELVAHCHNGKQHHRGCFVVDALTFRS